MTADTRAEQSARVSSWLAIALAAVVVLLNAAMIPFAVEPAHISVWLPGGAPP